MYRKADILVHFVPNLKITYTHLLPNLDPDEAMFSLTSFTIFYSNELFLALTKKADTKLMSKCQQFMNKQCTDVNKQLC